jgi:hypothetical protein
MVLPLWKIEATGNHRVANMTVRNVETLRFDAGNRYEDAEERLRGWYRLAALTMEAKLEGRQS